MTGEVGWLPASAFWIGEPQLTAFSSNGLASGNTPDEAVVHGTLEVLERDAIARLSAGGMSAARLAPCAVDLATIDEPRVAGLVERLRTAGVDLVLMRVPSQVAVHTMWAVLLDPRSPLACSRVNLGQGAHLSPATAAIRAITEAAQSRLTFIHGAREDLATDSYGHDASHDRLIGFFAGLEPSLDWRDLPDRATGEVAGDRRLLAAMLADAPLGDAFTVDLTRADIGISVAKTVIPGAWYRQGFFVRRSH